MIDIEAIGKKYLGEIKEEERVKKEDKRKSLPQLFKPGVGGNPAGRPKGSKNKVTLLREAVIAEAEESLLQNWNSIVKKTIQLANNGDSTCLKILWDRIMPAREEKKDKDKLNITINVNGMDIESVGGEKIEEKEIIDGEIVEDGDK